jgi:YggT family protein
MCGKSLEEIMNSVFGFLAMAVSIYSILILIRIIISWFGHSASGKPVEILCVVTDPYLNWWRRNLNLRIGFLDFSAVAGIVVLSLLQNILYTISLTGGITIAIVSAILILGIWNIISFILGFFIIILILRLIAYLTNRNIYSPFWNIIDSVSQPILYKFNRIFYGNRIGNYLKGMILSVLTLVIIWISGRFIVQFIISSLSRLPV